MKANFYRMFCVMLCLSALHCYGQEQREDGFVWLTEINYMSVRGFSEGLAPVYNGENWGYIDHSGNEVIEPKFNEVSPFADGLAIVKYNTKYGVITKDGRQVFEFLYDEILPFSCDMALAERDGEQFYLKTDGTVIGLTSRYKYSSFHDNMASIQGRKFYGYINKSGKVVVDAKYRKAYNFAEGLALVKLKNGTQYYIDKKGRTQTSYSVFNGVDPNFTEGVARYTARGKWGLINRKAIVIPAAYDEIGQLSEGYYPVKTSSIWGYVGLDKATISPRFAYAEPFSCGYACVKTISKYGYIDASGTMVIPDMFDQCTSMDDGYAVVEKDGRKGIIKLRTYSDAIAEVACGRAVITDANKNDIIETGEEFTINFAVKNIGSKAIKDLVITPTLPFEYQSNFTYEETYAVGDIPVGGSVDVEMKMLASNDINNVETTVEMDLLASNMFNSKTITTPLTALGSITSELMLTNYWFYNENYDEIEIGDSVTFRAKIKNVGQAMATNVEFRAAWPGYLLRSPKKDFTQEQLMPGESLTFTTSFVVDTTCLKKDLSFFTELSDSDNDSQIEYLRMHIGEVNKFVDLTKEQDDKQDYMAQTPVLAPVAVAAPSVEVQDDELLELLANVSPSMLKNNRFALVVGNENYSQQSVTYEQDVDFAKRDAVAFSEYAKKIMGIPENNLILLENATAAKMKQSINKLIKIANSYAGTAELVVFYAGHGQHDTESKETYLIPVDVSLTNPTSGIALAGLYEQLGNSQAAKVNVFLDACYSGVGRGIVVEVKESRVPGNMLVMTATSATQKSMPYKEKEHGLFTYYLLKTLGDNKGDITMQDLYRNVNQEVKRNSIWLNSSEQSPAIIEGEALKSDWGYWNFK